MDKISTTGVIDQTIYSDGGNVMYIVNVEHNLFIIHLKQKVYLMGKKFLWIIGKHPKEEIDWLKF